MKQAMAKTSSNWDKLSPAEFQQLQDYASYSARKLKDVVAELNGTGPLSKYSNDGDIDFEGFKLFLNAYLEVTTPEDLCQHLFSSFIKRPSNRQNLLTIPNCNAATSSENSCKDMVNGVSTETTSNHCPEAGPSRCVVRISQPENIPPPVVGKQHQGFSEKLHILSEKLHNFSLYRNGHDSDSSSRYRSGSLGGCVHPMVKLTESLSDSEDANKSSDSSPSHSAVSRNSSRNSKNSIHLPNGKLDDPKVTAPSSNAVVPKIQIDLTKVNVPLKDIVCYLSLLEGGRPEDKLEFMFRLYDSDGNGVLDTDELDNIVDQMMSVAENLGWDISELKPILQDMMVEIDYDADGTVSLEEWKRGGLTTIPLLVLLGLDQNVKEDGNHYWRLKHFSRPTYCNLCLTMLVGLGKKGLCCVYCRYTVHERCVQKAPANCICTYIKSKKLTQVMSHHWIEGNCHGRCSKCKKAVKTYNGITGMHCRWCQTTLHNRCASIITSECTMGEYRSHILPPISICPMVLDRERSFTRERRSIAGISPSETETGDQLSPHSAEEQNASTQAVAVTAPLPNSSGGPTSFHITPLANTRPLLVFINPKSGGRQGPKLLRKFQYILNPRQVYNMTAGGPTKALQMFKDVPEMLIICCGGDGTVGWLLDCMDKVQFACQPAVGVIPLGTGNDLARCLRWGGGYEGETLGKILKKIDKASPTLMDRWEINISDVNESETPGDPMPYNIINNYFSVGVDASICVKFHVEREKNPHKFNSRLRNKMWYFEFGMTEQFQSTCKNLHREVEIECDGVALELSKGPSLQGLAFLNIPFTHGGTNMWGDHLSRRRAKQLKRKKKDKKDDLSVAVQDIGDKLIEVIGLENCLHMGQVRTGLRASGRRLAQCSTIVVRTKKRFPMQIDGEPWMQPPCTIRVQHKNQVPMLMAPERKGIFSFFSRSD